MKCYLMFYLMNSEKNKKRRYNRMRSFLFYLVVLYCCPAQSTLNKQVRLASNLTPSKCMQRPVLNSVRHLRRETLKSIDNDQNLLRRFHDSIKKELSREGLSLSTTSYYQELFSSLVPIYCFGSPERIFIGDPRKLWVTPQNLSHDDLLRLAQAKQALQRQYHGMAYRNCSDCTIQDSWQLVTRQALRFDGALRTNAMGQNYPDGEKLLRESHHRMTLMTIGRFFER